MMFLFILAIALCHDAGASSASISLTIHLEAGAREFLAGKTSPTTPAELAAFESALGSCRESLGHHLKHTEVERIMRSIIGDSLVITQHEAWLSGGSHGGIVVQTIDGAVFAL